MGRAAHSCGGGQRVLSARRFAWPPRATCRAQMRRKSVYFFALQPSVVRFRSTPLTHALPFPLRRLWVGSTRAHATGPASTSTPPQSRGCGGGPLACASTNAARRPRLLLALNVGGLVRRGGDARVEPVMATLPSPLRLAW